MKKKLKSILVPRFLFVSWRKGRVVVGRPGHKRHVTIDKDRRRLKFHLTNERFPSGHPKRNQHLAHMRFDALDRFGEDMSRAGSEAFLETLVPVTVEELEAEGFGLLTKRSYGMTTVRAFVSPSLRPQLKFKVPDEAQMEELVEHVMGRLSPPSELDSFKEHDPGTVMAVYRDEEICCGFTLFYCPRTMFRPDGSQMRPGWYALMSQDKIMAAHAKVLLKHVGPKFFSKLERLLRFLRLHDEGEVARMEDWLHRLANGESFESLSQAKMAELAAQRAEAS